MNSKVPFMDLSRIHAPLREEILERVGRIIDRSSFILGTEVERFEKEFAAYVGTASAIGVANGLDALKLSLQSLGVGPGDEVITAANTFAATAFAISSLGARPVFAEIEARSYTLDPASVEKALTPKTKVILPVHLYGQPATMAPLLGMAKKRGIEIVEDCAQAHGAKYEGKNVGTFGAAGCFSFYPGKNLGAFGDGGAITTDRPDVERTLRILRDVGQSEKYHHTHLGHNSRLDAIQAAILSLKLPGLDAQIAERVTLAARYADLLGEIDGVQLPETLPDRTHVFHLYVILTRSAKDRDALRKRLGDAGIQTGLHYPIPLHLQECYASLGYRRGDFPVAENAAERLLSLPIFPGMRDFEIEAVAGEIREHYGC